MAKLALVSSFPVLFQSYIAQQEETLLFKGRPSGTGCDISTIDGHVLFAVEPTLGRRRRMRVLDAKGKRIFCTRKEAFRLRGSRYFIEKPSWPWNSKLFTLEFRMSCVATTFTASFNESPNDRRLLFHRRNSSNEGTVRDGAGGPLIAQVEQEGTMLGEEYQVVVAKGADMALIAALIVCLDHRDKSR